MAVRIPTSVAETDMSRRLGRFLNLLHRGKVRDTYELPGIPGCLLSVVTDRASIFDFVLGSAIPGKGEVLNATNIFWMTNHIQTCINHLGTYGKGIDHFLPLPLRRYPELQRRASIIRKLQMMPVECIVRGYLTGSGLKAYQADGKVCGIQLPEGLTDGSILDPPIFTPTTKAQEGHDEHLPVDEVSRVYGDRVKELSLSIYKEAQAYAITRGIILADTKFEFGKSMNNKSAWVKTQGLVLGDEALTPDSSRFWYIEEYEQARREGRAPRGHDKEPLRQAGKQALINGQLTDISTLDPRNPIDRARAAAWEVPQKDIDETTQRYHNIFTRLTRMPLYQFQEEVMGVRG